MESTEGRFSRAFVRSLEPVVFGRQRITAAVLGAATLVLALAAAGLERNAGFEKRLPSGHEYTEVYRQYQGVAGRANRILVALVRRDGTIYDGSFLRTLSEVTDAVFFLPGIDRASVTSLFTPNVIYVEVTEGDLIAGTVVPAEYQPTPEMIDRVRANVAKTTIVGRLVAVDHRGAMIWADLLERDPATGEALDVLAVARGLEEIRARFGSDDVSVHIIGFAKAAGEVGDAAAEVVAFFGLTLALTLGLLWLYCGSLRVAALPLGGAIVAVIWQLGLMRLFGLALDPYAILVPFLVLALAVSHGVQITSFWLYELAEHGLDSFAAARATFRRLVVPGLTALLTNIVGFATILLIPVPVVREMALAAMLGCVGIVVAKKVLLPLLLSRLGRRDGAAFQAHQRRRDAALDRLWDRLSVVAGRRGGAVVLLVAAALYVAAEWHSRGLRIGELQATVPELRADARYNLDAAAIARRFAVAQDVVLTVIAEAAPDACIDHRVMEAVDRFAWHMRNVPGIVRVRSLPQLAARVNAIVNEGHPKWQVLPRNRYLLVQGTGGAGPGSGLASEDCSAMPVELYLADHRAETIERAADAVKAFRATHPEPGVTLALAAGNAGVIAASNEVIRATERPLLLWVYAAIALCVWLSFGTLASVVCVLVPLVLVSMLAYAAMVWLGIGLTVTTLPVAAFAAGIGVDYGIYIYSVLEERVALGEPLCVAYRATLHQTGKAVAFTALALGAGVGTWLLSGLQFQVDMGLLLGLMFIANAVAAVLLLPALAAFLLRPRPSSAGSRRRRPGTAR